MPGVVLPPPFSQKLSAIDLDQADPRYRYAPRSAGAKMGAVKGRRLIRTLARATLVMLLFAQGALVAEACLRLDASPRAAFASSQMEGCDMAIGNPNACLFAYLDQSDHTAAQPTVPPATSYVVVASTSLATPARACDSLAALPPPGRAPPIPIRYCTLLI